MSEVSMQDSLIVESSNGKMFGSDPKDTGSTPFSTAGSSTMKLCVKCGLHEQREYNSYCKYCHNEYQKAYYKKNPRSINESSIRRRFEIRELVKLAKDVPCADCGKKYPYYVMDLDHVRGEKSFNLSIAARTFRALKMVQAEIDKCDVVCANCHRERTFNRRIEE